MPGFDYAGVNQRMAQLPKARSKKIIGHPNYLTKETSLVGVRDQFFGDHTFNHDALQRKAGLSQ
jgi:hypothetical protein